MKLLNQKWMQKLQYYTNYMYKGKVIIITNITHIKFIKVLDKLYRVTDISLSDMSISGCERCIFNGRVAGIPYYTIQQTRKVQYYGLFRVEKAA